MNTDYCKYRGELVTATNRGRGWLGWLWGGLGGEGGEGGYGGYGRYGGKGVLTSSGRRRRGQPSGRSCRLSCPLTSPRGVCAQAASPCARRKSHAWHCEDPSQTQNICGERGGPVTTL